jgi:hypothetical protein
MYKTCVRNGAKAACVYRTGQGAYNFVGTIDYQKLRGIGSTGKKQKRGEERRGEEKRK